MWLELVLYVLCLELTGTCNVLFPLQLKRGFTSDIDIIGQVVRGLGPSGSYPRCDLSELFRIAATEAQQSIALNRKLRVVNFNSQTHHFTSI